VDTQCSVALAVTALSPTAWPSRPHNAGNVGPLSVIAVRCELYVDLGDGPYLPKLCPKSRPPNSAPKKKLHTKLQTTFPAWKAH